MQLIFFSFFLFFFKKNTWLWFDAKDMFCLYSSKWRGADFPEDCRLEAEEKQEAQ